MAFWKKTTTAGPPNEPGDKGGQEFTPEPEKAARFFNHAKTVGETGNHEYAMQLWLSGLRFDPGHMGAMESFFAQAAQFLASSDPKKLSKDVAGAVGGRSDVDKYLSSLLEWSMRPTESANAVRACELAAELKLAEPTYWIGERALGACRLDKKVRKESYLKLMEALRAVNAFDKAVEAGEAAIRLDPADGALSADVRNLAAQATMNKGGYDQTGQQGGFRANVRDLAKQQQLEEADRLSKTEETMDRVLAAAEEEYNRRPDDLPSLQKFVQRLRERGKPEDERRAYALLMSAYERSGQFRYRSEAADIKIRQERRALSELKLKYEANPADEAAKTAYRRAAKAFTETELAEYLARAEAYPTDLGIKFEIGKRQFALGKYDDAIAAFQESQNEGKFKADSLNFMAQSFLKHEWVGEAVETFRRALELKDLLPDKLMEIKYGLMISLQTQAEQARDPAAAEEADKLASQIAIQQIGYRDIKARREAIKKLLLELRAKPA